MLWLVPPLTQPPETWYMFGIHRWIDPFAFSKRFLHFLPWITLWMLLFAPTRCLYYQFMVNEVKEKGFYSYVARNINVFKHLSNTLRFWKIRCLETLEIVSVNSLDVEFFCGVCKGSNVSHQATNPFCYSCGRKFAIVKQSVLPAKIAPQDGEAVGIIFQGVVINSVLGFFPPILAPFQV
ncbi:hypothetical protein GOP47_0025510 [Adiantum capillus-veneris]|uniref:Uncharacterized protein n=1 Tax=Adiantum capillus-veneris TaxID=13818 RepID=A0A9D4U2W4_ADICA|nr:hypothetical protein GOP47_0025510 [Adiantum capillus-veneris]